MALGKGAALAFTYGGCRAEHVDQLRNYLDRARFDILQNDGREVWIVAQHAIFEDSFECHLRRSTSDRRRLKPEAETARPRREAAGVALIPDWMEPTWGFEPQTC